MLAFKEVLYVDEVSKNITAILVADIGGTNSNFGIFQSTNGKLKLLFSMHYKSQKITQFTNVVNQTLNHIKETYNITIHNACFAAAGVVSEHRDYAKPTNLDFGVDTQEIIQKTDLECACIVNDFEIIGHGLEEINPKDIVLVKSGSQRVTGNRAILGAGTGLGKCILLFNKHVDHYEPVASEGGHADFSPQSELEFELVNFIKKTEKRTCNISWEDVLSGYGIERIYKFFLHKNGKQNADKDLVDNGLHPDEIFANRNRDEHARNTFELYTKFYARCAKNFALDALALGGVYIAGGIAAKNLPLFELSAFMDEFINCGKQMALLKKIPIFVITDYNISLYGAARYMLLEGLCA